MTGETDNRSSRWALPASAVVHVLVAALIIFGVPVSMPKPQEEEAVSVTIEPPQEEAASEPPPPPPAEEPAQPPPPPAQEQSAAPPVPVLNPVVKFGERDAGPREALDGSAAEDDPLAPTQSPIADEKAATEEASRESPAEDAPPPAATESAESTESTESTETAESDAAAQPDAPVEEDTGTGAPQLVASAAADKAAAPAASGAPAPDKAEVEEEKAEEKAMEATADPTLREVRTLFSRSSNLDAAATLAMANIPRGVRAGRLCATELRLQLQYGPTAYTPEWLTSYKLDEGTVLSVRHGSFRAGGAWYNVSFECQVDPEATEVVSFAYRVGERLSPEEAKRRRVPSQ